MAVQINQNTYGFIRAIASKFDQQTFPEVTSPNLILDPKTDGIKWSVNKGAQVEILAGRTLRIAIANQLPPQFVGEISSHADNFSEWVVILGLTDPKVKMSAAALDYSAVELLKRMKIERNAQSAVDQLLTHVFQQAFSSSSMEEQLKCVQQMRDCGSVTESYSFKWRYVYFKVQSAVAAFFSNPLVRITIGGVVVWGTMIAAVYSTKVYFDRTFHAYYVLKMVNIFHRRAPWTALIVTSIVTHVIARFLSKAFTVSQTLQRDLAASSKTASSDMQAQLIAENRDKAYQLWMYLMKNPTLLYASSAG